MKTAYDLTRRSFYDLIEHNIPLADEKRIQEIICDHASEYAGFLTRKNGEQGRKYFSSFTMSCPARFLSCSLTISPIILNQISKQNSRGELIPSILNP